MQRMRSKRRKISSSGVVHQAIPPAVFVVLLAFVEPPGKNANTASNLKRALAVDVVGHSLRAGRQASRTSGVDAFSLGGHRAMRDEQL